MTKQLLSKVRQLTSPWVTHDPFLFCVHHNDHYPSGNTQLGVRSDSRKGDWSMYHGTAVPGFPAHPHRGFETITIVSRGTVDHADSLGATARYGAGDVQWLTAGRGIQHSEMFPSLDQDDANHLELFQIWLNLPAVSKMVEPHFKIFWRHQVSEWVGKEGRVRIRVIAGALPGAQSPAPPPHSWAAQEHSDVAIYMIDLASHSSWDLPATSEASVRTLYYYEGLGGLGIGENSLPPAHSAELRSDVVQTLRTDDSPARLLFLQGRPIGEPVAKHGPFVMNTMEELKQAFVDYRSTQFGGWPWDSQEPVHGQKNRFANYPDGNREEPDLNMGNKGQ